MHRPCWAYVISTGHDLRAEASISPRRSVILPVTLGFVLIWVGILVMSQIALGLGELFALGAAGGLISGVLAALARRHERHLQSLAETDPLTGLTNLRGFHAS